MDNLSIYLVVIVVLIVLILVLVSYLASRQNKNDTPIESDEEKLNREYELHNVQAKVTDLSCAVLTKGYRPPRTFKEFTVTFETIDERVVKLNVSEEMYSGFEMGQTGTLTTVEGELFSFVLD